MFFELPVRIKPHIDESLNSFIQRLSEANNFESSYILYKLAGLTGNTFTARINMVCLHKLSTLSGIGVEGLNKLTFSKEFEETNNKEIDNLVNMKGIYLLQTKVCPKCLLENGYYRKVWGIGLYTVCHIHNILMIENCPNCGVFLSYNFDSITRCKCGFELINCNAKEMECRTLENFLLINYLD